MNDRLLMPPVIHGTVGEEMNLYFANLFTVLNPANYAFQFYCEKGSCCEERWHFTPGKDDVGTFEASLEIYDDNGLVASGKCSIIIHDPAAAAGKKLRLLMIGDSLTDQSHYPAHIHTLCKRYGVDLEMLGTNMPEMLYNQPGQLIKYPDPELLRGVRHEGYGGWTAGGFLTRKNADKVEVMTLEDGTYAASSDEIAAKYLDRTVYVAAVYESNGVTYSSGVLPYSIAAYCQKPPAGVQDLATAAAIYGGAAKQYFGA